jgi:hypothetical protein
MLEGSSGSLIASIREIHRGIVDDGDDSGDGGCGRRGYG